MGLKFFVTKVLGFMWSYVEKILRLHQKKRALHSISMRYARLAHDLFMICPWLTHISLLSYVICHHSEYDKSIIYVIWKWHPHQPTYPLQPCQKSTRIPKNLKTNKSSDSNTSNDEWYTQNMSIWVSNEPEGQQELSHQ